MKNGKSKEEKNLSGGKYARMLDLVVSGRWGCVWGIFFFLLFFCINFLPYTGGQGRNKLEYLSSFLPLLIFNEKDIRLS